VHATIELSSFKQESHTCITISIKEVLFSKVSTSYQQTHVSTHWWSFKCRSLCYRVMPFFKPHYLVQFIDLINMRSNTSSCLLLWKACSLALAPAVIWKACSLALALIIFFCSTSRVFVLWSPSIRWWCTPWHLCAEVALATLLVALAAQWRHLPTGPDLLGQPALCVAVIAEASRVQSAVYAWSAKRVSIAHT